MRHWSHILWHIWFRVVSSPLAHSSNEKQNAITLISKNKSSNLTDENILIELENDNANDNVKTIFESTETKPLPKKGFSEVNCDMKKTELKICY